MSFYLALGLAFLWALLCLYGFTRLIDWMKNHRSENTPTVLFLAMIALIVFGASPLLVLAKYYDNRDDPVLETLRTSEWRCTASHQSMWLLPTAKSVLPVPTTVCDRYERVKR